MRLAQCPFKSASPEPGTELPAAPTVFLRSQCTSTTFLTIVHLRFYTKYLRDDNIVVFSFRPSAHAMLSVLMAACVSKWHHTAQQSIRSTTAQGSKNSAELMGKLNCRNILHFIFASQTTEYAWSCSRLALKHPM